MRSGLLPEVHRELRQVSSTMMEYKVECRVVKWNGARLCASFEVRRVGYVVSSMTW
jgi:hypothetical protein